MNSIKIPFTLTQKVYMVRTYYKQETIRYVVDCLLKRFNIQLKESEVRVVSQLILEFEASGSVLRDFYYTKDVPGISRAPAASKPSALPASFWAKGIKEPPKEEEQDKVEVAEVEVSDDDDDQFVVMETAEDEGLEEIIIEDPLPAAAPAAVEKTTQKKKQEDWRHCLICDKWFPKTKYGEHVSEVHENGELTCKECGKAFAHKRLLQQHLKTHGVVEKPKETLICEVCGRVSSSRKTQKAHMLVHSSEKNHVCPECGMRFVRLEGMKRHLRKHTGEKPYVCKHCGLSFSAFMSHQMHVRLHTGERPFNCHHCGEAFIGAPALNNHLKMHVGEYVHECYVCHSRFKTQKTMEEHLVRKHSAGCEEIIEMVIQNDE